ncbi:MAG: radical SAM protein [Dehalococcoidia bacterium]
MDYRPRVVSWNITGACNLRCAHCYLDAGKRWPGELSTEEGIRLIDQMAEEGTELLILTGGEPLLRKDLCTLAQHATTKRIAVVLGTTGTLINRSVAKDLKQSGVVGVGISIDSLDPAKHDAFRGAPGAWHRALNGIEACRAEGLDLLVHTTALKMNYEEIPALAQFAHDRGARAFHLFFLVCTGRGEQQTDLSPQEYRGLLSFLLDAQGSYPNMMVRARCAPYIGRLAQEQEATLSWSAGCLAGTSYCRVTPTGDVTPCPYLPLKAGNVRESSFGAIWSSSQVLSRLRNPLLKGKCGRCNLARMENPICIGCRARAFALRGDELEEDPWCMFGPQQEEIRPQAALSWTPEASARIDRIPRFIRGRVKQGAEAYARKHGVLQITPQLLDEFRARAFGKGHTSYKG